MVTKQSIKKFRKKKTQNTSCILWIWRMMMSTGTELQLKKDRKENESRSKNCVRERGIACKQDNERKNPSRRSITELLARVKESREWTTTFKVQTVCGCLVTHWHWDSKTTFIRFQSGQLGFSLVTSKTSRILRGYLCLNIDFSLLPSLNSLFSFFFLTE